MKAGYLYLDAVWPSQSDCNEIELSIFEEEIYIFAMKRICDSPQTWRERTKAFHQQLLQAAKQQAHKQRRYIKIMD